MFSNVRGSIFVQAYVTVHDRVFINMGNNNNPEITIEISAEKVLHREAKVQMNLHKCCQNNF